MSVQPFSEILDYAFLTFGDGGGMMYVHECEHMCPAHRQKSEDYFQN